MDAKTPATILNDILNGQFAKPVYKLLHDGTGKFDDIFKYELEFVYNGTKIKTIGTGKTKKDAKQNSAAEALTAISKLKQLKKVSAVKESPVVTVGDPESLRRLSNYCNSNCYPQPSYTFIAEPGPKHSKSFTVKCKVKDHELTVTASSKKKARQTAAHNMYEKLRTTKVVRERPPIMITEEEIQKSLDIAKRLELAGELDESEYPFAVCGKEKCLKAVRILGNNSLGFEERVKQALAVLEVYYEFRKVPATENRFLHSLVIPGVKPEIHIPDFEMDDLYYKACKYLISFLL